MVGWYARLVTAIAAIVLLLGTGTVAHAVGDEQAVLVPGAMPFKQINPVYPLLRHFLYPYIGIHFHDDDDPELIDYSQNPLAVDRAVRQGVDKTIVAVREIDGKVVVIGESMGSMVAARVAVELADSSEPPLVDDLRIVLIVPLEVGIAEYFTEGTYIPILNYRVSRLPESPYSTAILIGEYDGWSNPPDRPWNLVSLFNSVMGMVFVHSVVALVDPADVPPENITVEQNSQGATVTTYLVPTEHLPLTQVFRLFLPGSLVDVADRVLRPIVDAGYVRHDRPGDPRPYLSEGRIVWPQQVAPAEAGAPEPVEPGGATLTGVDRPGLAASTASTESGGGSAPAPEPEPAAEVQDDPIDAADPAEDLPEVDETEPAPDPELEPGSEPELEPAPEPEPEPDLESEESGTDIEQDSADTAPEATETGDPGPAGREVSEPVTTGSS